MDIPKWSWQSKLVPVHNLKTPTKSLLNVCVFIPIKISDLFEILMDGFGKAVVTGKGHSKSKEILKVLLKYILFVLQKLAC